MVDKVSGYLYNSFVIMREGDGPLFSLEDNKLVARLDGYAIIPVENYHNLKSEINTLLQYLNICRKYGPKDNE